MKVLAITDTPDLPEMALLRGLAKQGVNLQVYSASTQCCTDVTSEIGVKQLKIKNKLDISAMKTVRKCLMSERFDIVHSFTGRALSVALMSSLGMNHIKHIAYRGTCGHLSKLDPTSWLTFLNPRLSAVSCVSKAVFDYLSGLGIPRTKLYQIYKGHDVTWYKKSTREELRKLGVSDGAFVVGFLGNMRPVKGADVLIEAIRQIPLEKNIELLLIGEVRDDRIRSLISKVAGRKIVVSGFRTDGPALIGACDVCVVPSRDREGLPKSLIEAMSMNVATIGSNVGGIPEVIENNISGILVEPGDISKLAFEIQQLAADDQFRHKIGEAGRVRVENVFSVNEMVAKTLDLYTRLCQS